MLRPATPTNATTASWRRGTHRVHRSSALEELHTSPPKNGFLRKCVGLIRSPKTKKKCCATQNGLPVAFLFFVFCFSIPFTISTLLFPLPPSRNSDPGSHSRLFSPSTHYGLCLAFLSREYFRSFFTLVDSRRIVLTHATRSQQLVLFFFLQINLKSRHGGIRTHGPTPVAFEGYH